MLIKLFQKRRRKWYQNNRWHFALDISLSLLILLMLTIFISLSLFNPQVDHFSPILGPKKPIDEEPVPILDPLELEISLNKNLVNENEDLIVYLKIKNSGKEKIENLNLELKADDNDFNLTNTNYYSEELAGMEVLELELKPKVSLKNALKRQLTWSLEAQFLYLDTEFKQELPLLNVYYNSRVQLKANAYYHNHRGDQLGLGPIPPIVGIPTTYYLFFEIENFGNNLNNFVLSANLANKVELTDNVSLLAGSYNYNSDNRRIVWQINEIDWRGGNYQAAFELKVTPQTEDLGKNLDLVSSIVYSYQDNLTKQQITGSMPKIDNTLPTDFINKGQGVVRE